MSKLKNFYLGAVNPPIYQASTIVFDNLTELEKSEKPYARSGTATNEILASAIAKLENAQKSIIVSSGVSAISSTLLSLLKTGDHILVVQSAYEPTKEFCRGVLKNFGIEIDYFPGDASRSDVAKLIKANSKIILLESPSSIVFEIQDLAGIAQLAKENNILTIIDNSWSAGYLLKPLNLDIDISIQSLSKYVSGHSDLLLGAISFKNLELYQKVWPNFYQLGDHASPQDCYLAYRGLQTLEVRLKQQQENAKIIVNLLGQYKQIKTILYPNLKSFKQYDLFNKYFSGSNSLLSIIFREDISEAQIKQFVNSLKYFKLGYSWGGYDSLVMYYKKINNRESIVRLAIGIEDVELLAEDLKTSLKHIC